MPKDFTGRLYSLLWLSVAIVFIVTQVLIQSTFAALAGRAGPLFLALSALSVMIGIGLAILRGQWLSATVALLLAGLIIGQMFTFSALTGYAVNFNVLFSYVNMIAFPLFSVAENRLRTALFALFLVSLIYCLIYIGAYDWFVATAAAADQQRWANPSMASTVPEGVRVLPGDGGREPRVYLAGTFATFVFFYSIVRMRLRRQLRWLPFAIVGLTAMVMANSRTYLLTIVIVATMYLIYLSRRETRVVLAAVFVCMAMFVVSGVPFDSWNPFAITAGDASGAARWRAYSYIRNYVAESPLLGIGIAPSGEAQTTLIGVPGVYWSDLGALGVWYTFGVFGLIAFCTQIVIAVVGIRRPDNLPVVDHVVLLLCCMVMGMSAALSPDAWGGANGVLMAIMMGLICHQDRPLLRRKPIWIGDREVVSGPLSRRRVKREVGSLIGPGKPYSSRSARPATGTRRP